MPTAPEGAVFASGTPAPRTRPVISARLLLRFVTGRFDDRPPALDFDALDLPELGRRRSCRLKTDRHDLGAHFRQVCNGADLLVQPLDDLNRSIRWGKECEPRRRIDFD